jgi:hypothetical protein
LLSLLSLIKHHHFELFQRWILLISSLAFALIDSLISLFPLLFLHQSS